MSDSNSTIKILCRVDGCGRDADYKAACLCQKHYFRQRRYATTELTRFAKERAENPEGYQWIYRPTHPLRHVTNGYVYEHRAVLYAALGDGPLACELCAKPLTWKSCHVDHIDENVRNNDRGNLRPTCSVCNTRRGMRPPAEWDRTHTIEFDGTVLTPAEWARDLRVNVCGHQIILRKKAGMSDEDALFSPKVTHNGNKPIKPPTPAKNTRKNSVNLLIDGLLMTSSEWTRVDGCTVTDNTLRSRVRAGWSHQDAVFTPAHSGTAKTKAQKAAA